MQKSHSGRKGKMVKLHSGRKGKMKKTTQWMEREDGKTTQWKEREEEKRFNYLPSCSTTSGGNTLEAKALRKIALNSLSSPPIPIFLKSQSGFMMDW